MDDKERKYWINILPIMSEDQKAKLREILVDEREKLAAIDRKYAAPAANPLESAAALLDKGDYQQAITKLTDVIASDPKNANALKLRGAARASLNDHRQAIVDFNAAIDLSPKSAVAIRNRAASYAKIGDYRHAIDDYTRAVDLDPKNARACNNLAWMLATCQDSGIRDGAEAIQYASRACELSDWKDPYYFDTLAAAYAELGKYDKAVHWQEKALEHSDFEKEVPRDEMVNAKKRLELYRSGKPYRQR